MSQQPSKQPVNHLAPVKSSFLDSDNNGSDLDDRKQKLENAGISAPLTQMQPMLQRAGPIKAAVRNEVAQQDGATAEVMNLSKLLLVMSRSHASIL